MAEVGGGAHSPNQRHFGQLETKRDDAWRNIAITFIDVFLASRPIPGAQCGPSSLWVGERIAITAGLIVSLWRVSPNPVPCHKLSVSDLCFRHVSSGPIRVVITRRRVTRVD